MSDEIISYVTHLECKLKDMKKELVTQRALADWLADALISTDAIIRKEVSLIGQWDSPVIFKEALAAWKEARSECR